MRIYATTPALLGPGLDGWEAAREVLAGCRSYVAAPLNAPPPQSLPPNERRRTSPAIRLGVAAAEIALDVAGEGFDGPASVFASANGDGAVVGAILEALAATPQIVSPTQFHNSVHNAPAAYWTIGGGFRASSTSLGGSDATFGAALLHAAATMAGQRRPVLLCAYDLPLPPPLDAVRPTAAPFAVAMVLTPEALISSLARLDLRFVSAPAPGPAEPRTADLLPLYRTNPAARSLRLLEALARGEAERVHLEQLEDAHVVVDVTPC